MTVSARDAQAVCSRLTRPSRGDRTAGEMGRKGHARTDRRRRRSARRALVRVCLLCDRMVTGGAEVLTLDVLSGLDRAEFRPEVLCLKDPGSLGPEFQARGIPLEVLGRRSRYDPATLPQLLRRFAWNGPDVVLTLTHHAP